MQISNIGRAKRIVCPTNPTGGRAPALLAYKLFAVTCELFNTRDEPVLMACVHVILLNSIQAVLNVMQNMEIAFAAGTKGH